MIRALLAALAVLVTATPVLAQTPEPVRVMVLGAWHFDNPGQDLQNMQAEPVTTPGRQAELAAVAGALARFEPTAIALERMAADQATLLDHRWPEFTPEMLSSRADERVQLGYRLAALTGVTRVYAIDEQPLEGEGYDYFPYGPLMEWAAAHGRTGELDAAQAEIGAAVAQMEAMQQTHTIGAMLAEINRPDHPLFGPANQQFQYGFLRMGSGRAWPGAELNSHWYERNAKIFSKLLQVAEPGDRIVVVIGAGHLFWMRHFLETMPGFELVEPSPYLAGL